MLRNEQRICDIVFNHIAEMYSEITPAELMAGMEAVTKYGFNPTDLSVDNVRDFFNFANYDVKDAIGFASIMNSVTSQLPNMFPPVADTSLQNNFNRINPRTMHYMTAPGTSFIPGTYYSENIVPKIEKGLDGDFKSSKMSQAILEYLPRLFTPPLLFRNKNNEPLMFNISKLVFDLTVNGDADAGKAALDSINKQSTNIINTVMNYLNQGIKHLTTSGAGRA